MENEVKQKPLSTTGPQDFKRKVAFKLRIGSIVGATPILENERLKFVELDNKQIVRVNIVANITDKYIQEGEKPFGSLTLDDGSGQVKAKLFGEDVEKIKPFTQGDTIVAIGLLRSWNNELYLTPEILKAKDPSFLLVRKLELDIDAPKSLPTKQLSDLKGKILSSLKTAESQGSEGVEIESLILDLKESPEIINTEIKKLLEDGVAYEPRPGKIRYLG